MAASESSLVDEMLSRIDALLERARSWKRGLSLEPALPAIEFAGDSGLPDVLTPKNARLHANLVETAARLKFHHIWTSISIEDPAFCEVWNLLDIINICANQGQCEPPLVWLLIEELLDVQSIEGCRSAFNYLESRRERLISKDFRTKNLIILRSCNELLRRLSRAEDTVFCGRVYIFLFQSFPLGDKSSVNLRGEFHTDNVTAFEDGVQPGTFPDDHDKDVEMSGDQSGLVGLEVTNGSATGSTVDSLDASALDKLYPIFWTLQKAFSNPATLFSEASLKGFKSGLEQTLAAFKQVPQVIQASTSEEKRGTKRKADEGPGDLANVYSPKYLTSRKLFGLELSDLAFQRHVLVQSLILLDFLLALTEKSKEKLAYINTQKALQYPMTLQEEDARWASDMRVAVASYLSEGPEGKFYYRMIDTVLSRDKNWVRWKMESCPAISKAPVAGEEASKAGTDLKARSRSKPIKSSPMGALEAGFLAGYAQKAVKDSQASDAISSTRGKDELNAQALLRAIENDSLDLDMAADGEEKLNIFSMQQNKSWRLIRLASKTRLRQLKEVKDTAGLSSLLLAGGSVAMTNVPRMADAVEA